MEASFGTWDYVSGSLVLAAASAIGIYHSFKARDVRDNKQFLVINKELSIPSVILSFVATLISAIGILGWPVESYMNGFIIVLYSIPVLITIPFGALLFLPVLYRLDVSSMFEYLELRFSRKVRLLASGLSLNLLIAFTTCVIYAPALAINQVTGLHLWLSVASVGLICILYTSLGGFKAVVWADVTQVVVMSVAVSFIFIKGTIDVGGLGNVWKICQDSHRTDILILSGSPYTNYTLWSLIIGGFFTELAYTTINQSQMQRFLSCKNLKSAKIIYAGGLIGTACFYSILAFGGLLNFAKYHQCDPLLSGQVSSRDQVMALFAVETLSFQKGLSGVFVAAVLCAAISTLSSVLNTMSTITMEDYIKPLKPNMADDRAIAISKILTLFYGVLCIGLVALAQHMGGVIKIVLGTRGVFGGPTSALFIMGMLIPWISSTGAILGFFAGLLLSGWAFVGSYITNPKISFAPVTSAGCSDTLKSGNFTWINNTLETLEISEEQNDVFGLYTVSVTWYGGISFCTAIVVAIIASVITGPQKPHSVRKELIFPFVTAFCLKLPNKYRVFLGYESNDSADNQKTEMTTASGYAD